MRQQGQGRRFDRGCCLAAGLPSLFGVARVGATTYATDTQGELLAVPDGGARRRPIRRWTLS